jgi:GNAT superfamily N-acetyltransferase
MKMRRICSNEIDTLMAWCMEVLHEVFADYDHPDWQALQKANREYYQREIPAEGHIAGLAEPGIGCGGLCLYNEMPSPDNPTGKCAYLMNVYVRPEYRGQGYGRQIVTWLVDQARQRGITKIYLEASECARKMYRELGFKEMKDYYKW